LTSTPSTVKPSGRKTLAHPQRTFPSSCGAPVPDASFLAGADALGQRRLQRCRLWLSADPCLAPLYDDGSAPVDMRRRIEPDAPRGYSLRASAEDRARPQLQVTDRTDPPRTHVHRLGKRVGGNPSRVRISYSPPVLTSPSCGDSALRGNAASRLLVTVRPGEGLCWYSCRSAPEGIAAGLITVTVSAAIRFRSQTGDFPALIPNGSDRPARSGYSVNPRQRSHLAPTRGEGPSPPSLPRRARY
jgi:hypothetical protein